jgi:hypothetical protein
MMQVRDRKKFWIGVVGLIIFSAILGFWTSPWGNHRTGLEFADNLFNQLAKHSTFFIPEAVKLAERFKGIQVDLGVNPRWPGKDKQMAQIIQANGFAAVVLGDGRVRIKGDLGLMGLTASADAELLFQGKDEDLQGKYGVSGKETIYYWWVAFDGLTRRFIQENRTPEADFSRFLTTRVLEPSYNFAGIKARNISENIGTVAFLLGFYVFYTLLYGFSILFLFEGLGIKATKAKEKKEA